MQTTRNDINFDSPNFGQQLLSKFVPYWPLFILAVILGGISAYFYLKYQNPVYQASATLIIKDEKKGSEESKLMESLDPISSKKIVENEVEVIQSRRLMEDVIKKLGLYISISQKGKYTTVSSYLTSPVKIISPTPDSLRGLEEDEHLFFTYEPKKKEVLLNGKDKYKLNKVIQTKYGKLIFTENQKFRSSQKLPKRFDISISNPARLAPSLLSRLQAEPASKLSSIVNLSYRDEVATRAEDILNQLIHSYRDFEAKEKDALAQNTLDFVENRLKLVSHDLDSIQKKIQEYKSQKGAVDISAQGQLYLQNVSTNDQKLSEVNTQLSVLNEVEKSVKDKNGLDAIVPATVGINDPMLSEMLTKLYESELEYARLQKTTGQNHPKLLTLRDQINKIRPNILQNIQNQKQSLLAARQNINTTNTGYNSILRSVPQKELELLDISREEQIKNNIYSFLLQKKEESEIAYASTVANNRVVDYAMASPSPVSPKKKLIYAIGIMLFLGIFLAIIAFRETLSGKIMYRDEIEGKTAIPVIGEIALDKNKQPLVIGKGTRSFIAEEFRKLRISLSYLGINEINKKILITSSISGEGKSFVSSNLAISISLTGKKVILVDMDLNNPTLSKVFNLKKSRGVSEYLQGSVDVKKIIQRVPDFQNLFFISPGSLPEDPAELLSNGKAKQLIDSLNNSFDMVIIDTSPMVLVTDGYLLTNYCDATLYVVRHGHTPKLLIKRIDKNNQINPIKNPAIVFNGVKKRGFFKNQYGYGYDYVYGYENIEKTKDKKSLVKT